MLKASKYPNNHFSSWISSPPDPLTEVTVHHQTTITAAVTVTAEIAVTVTERRMEVAEVKTTTEGAVATDRPITITQLRPQIITDPLQEGPLMATVHRPRKRPPQGTGPLRPPRPRATEQPRLIIITGAPRTPGMGPPIIMTTVYPPMEKRNNFFFWYVYYCYVPCSHLWCLLERPTCLLCPVMNKLESTIFSNMKCIEEWTYIAWKKYNFPMN